MLKFIRISAGADPAYQAHLESLKKVYLKAFPFNAAYLDKIEAYSAGQSPAESEVIILAALKGNRLLGFSVTFYFADLKAAYLDYIASDPARAARGIGGAIYEMTRDDLKKRGARRLYLDSLPDQPELLDHKELLHESRRRMAFYERLGARPVVGTAYERTLTPSNLGDANMLLCDAMGDASPLPRRTFKAVVARIMLAKNDLDATVPLVDGLLRSIVDDPIRIRAPRYAGSNPRAQHTLTDPIHVVFASSDSPTIEHSPFKGYYERPSRVTAVRRALEDLPVAEHRPTHWGLEHVRAVHDRRMVQYIEDTAEKIPAGRIVYPEIFPIRFPDRLPRNFEMRAGYFCIDTSTPLTNAVYPAARKAVDASLTAAKLIETKAAPWCYVAVRPPGHHAERRVFGGFCYFNNAAVAAHYLSKSGRVVVLDIDHHHGNGTQDIFYERSDVLTVSIHGHPEESYPFFAGFEDERGTGAGQGFNRNYPIRPGVDDAGYLTVLGRAMRRIKAFQPEYLIVSLGVDIMKGDPTGNFFVTGNGMRRIGEAIGRGAYRSLVVQEGGYNLANIRRGVREFLIGYATGHKAGPERTKAGARG